LNLHRSPKSEQSPEQCQLAASRAVAREKRRVCQKSTKAFQKDLNDDPHELEQFLMWIGKILLNLKTKLSRFEVTNEKLVEAYEQSSDTEAAEKFQPVLDGDADFIEGIIDKISELKVLKEAVERKHRESEARHNPSLDQRVREVQEQMKHLQSTSHSPEVASIWSQPSLGPMKPP